MNYNQFIIFVLSYFFSCTSLCASDQKIDSIFNKAQNFLIYTKSATLNYVMSNKPAMRSEPYFYNINLQFDKTVLNDDSIANFHLKDGEKFQMILNSGEYFNIYSNDSSIIKYQIDTVNYPNISSIVKDYGRFILIYPFIISNYKFEYPLRWNSSSLTDVSFQNELCCRIDFITKTKSSSKPDSLIYIFRKSDNCLLYYKKSNFNKSANGFQVFTFQLNSLQNRNEENLFNGKQIVDGLMKMGFKYEIYKAKDFTNYISKADTIINMNNFVIYTDKGDSISRHEIKAKLLLVDFSYLSCLPCLKGIPMMNKLYSDYKSKGLELFWIDPVDFKDFSFTNKKLQEMKVKFPVYYDSNKIVYAENGIETFPYFFLVEPLTGKILYRNFGFEKKLEKELRKEISKYLE